MEAGACQLSSSTSTRCAMVQLPSDALRLQLRATTLICGQAFGNDRQEAAHRSLPDEGLIHCPLRLCHEDSSMWPNYLKHVQQWAAPVVRTTTQSFSSVRAFVAPQVLQQHADGHSHGRHGPDAH